MKKLGLAFVVVIISGATAFHILTRPVEAEIAGHDSVTAIYSPAAVLGKDENGRYPVSGDSFGSDVAIRGDLLLVGADHADQVYMNGDDAGAAYLINIKTEELVQTYNIPETQDTTTPTERLHSGERQHDPMFGAAVAMNDNFVLIGAPRDEHGDGAAYLFDLESGDFVHRFTNPDMIESGFFGQNIALSDTKALIVVGNAHNRVMYEQGYLFDLSNPDRMIRLPTGNTKPDVANIYSVAMNNSYTVLARQYYIPIDTAESSLVAGKVQVFDSCTGTLTQSLERGRAIDNFFGADLALHDNHLLIGAPNIYDAASAELYGVPLDGHDARGAAFLYDLATGEFVKEIRSPSSGASSNFGQGVAINRTHALVQQSDEVMVFDLETGQLILSESAGDPPLYGQPYALSATDAYFAIGVHQDNYMGYGVIVSGSNAGASFIIALDEQTNVPSNNDLPSEDCQTGFDANAESALSAAEVTLAAYSAISAYVDGDMTYDEALELTAKAGFDDLRWQLTMERMEMSDMQRAIENLNEVREILNGLN